MKRKGVQVLPPESPGVSFVGWAGKRPEELEKVQEIEASAFRGQSWT
jgi:hypothetical protein